MRKFLIYFGLTFAILMANIATARENLTFIAVVVSSQQNTNELKLSSKNLNLIYWRKQLFWPAGLRIKPVNLRSQDPLRLQFSKTVLGSTPNAQIDYWNGQYFNGILPPHAVDSEEAVIRYVSQTKGAVGYVNACSVDDRVQTLLWLTPNGEIKKTQPETLNCSE
jgi:ABC-type phosphate transport system substrate-binding protein